MLIHRELSIRGASSWLRNFIHEVEVRLSHGWTRNQELESRIDHPSIGKYFCFTRPAPPSCDVWLIEKPGELYVCNVLPLHEQELTIQEHNRAVTEFCDLFARPAAQAAGLLLELGSSKARLENYLSPETAVKLRAFSITANRSAPHHPSDIRNWNDFLAAAHRENSRLDTEMLRRWLTEDQRWPEKTAYIMTMEYELARGLLAQYDGKAA